MSTSKSQSTICMPAHILDANISPRAREVLMLLASQTTPENPTLWVCPASIADKLRCSPVTVKRAIQKLLEAKLILETGDLHERRFKFYRVRWSPKSKRGHPRLSGIAKTGSPRCACDEEKPNHAAVAMTGKPRSDESTPPTSTHPGVDYAAMLKDSRIAYWAEVRRPQHEENLRQYKMFLLSHPECKTEEDRRL